MQAKAAEVDGAAVDSAKVEGLQEELASAMTRISELEAESVAKDEYLEQQKKDMLSLMRSATQVSREESER